MKLLTVQEVAEVVKVSVTTVRRWIKDRSLPAYKVGKRGQLRIKEEELDTFIEHQRVGSVDSSEDTRQRDNGSDNQFKITTE